jgi:histone chaperone ASF1
MEAHLCRIRKLVSAKHAVETFTLNSHTNLCSSEYDQELDNLLVGPIPVGVNKFLFEADPPNVSKLPSAEILGVTVILLTCAYDGREFVRVGYYVSNEYDTPELQNEPPKQPILDRIVRNMLTEKPRVTRFAIKWYITTIATREMYQC